MAIGKLRGKKKWFTVLAPEIFKSKEVVDITAYEPQELVGRPVELNYSQLTERPKDQYKKLILKITDTRGEKAITVPWRYYLVDSFVQRLGRKYNERVYEVVKEKSKDGKMAGIKIFIMATKDLRHSVRANLLKTARGWLAKEIADRNAYDLFIADEIEKLSDGLRDRVKKIYPVDKILVWKISVS